MKKNMCEMEKIVELISSSKPGIGKNVTISVMANMLNIPFIPSKEAIEETRRELSRPCDFLGAIKPL